MKFEDINSDKFLKFSDSVIDSSKAVIRGGYITEGGGHQTGMVDYYSTHNANGGDGVEKPMTLAGNATWLDSYGSLP